MATLEEPQKCSCTEIVFLSEIGDRSSANM